MADHQRTPVANSCLVSNIDFRMRKHDRSIAPRVLSLLSYRIPRPSNIVAHRERQPQPREPAAVNKPHSYHSATVGSTSSSSRRMPPHVFSRTRDEDEDGRRTKTRRGMMTLARLPSPSHLRKHPRRPAGPLPSPDYAPYFDTPHPSADYATRINKGTPETLSSLATSYSELMVMASATD